MQERHNPITTRRIIPRMEAHLDGESPPPPPQHTYTYTLHLRLTKDNLLSGSYTAMTFYHWRSWNPVNKTLRYVHKTLPAQSDHNSKPTRESKVHQSTLSAIMRIEGKL